AVSAQWLSFRCTVHGWHDLLQQRAGYLQPRCHPATAASAATSPIAPFAPSHCLAALASVLLLLCPSSALLAVRLGHFRSAAPRQLHAAVRPQLPRQLLGGLFGAALRARRARGSCR